MKALFRSSIEKPGEPLKTVILPVIAEITSEITVTGTLFFGIVKEGTSPTKTIEIRSATGVLPKIETARFDDGLANPKSEADVQVDRGRITVKLTKAPKGYHQWNLVVITDNKDRPVIKIPVYAMGG